MPEKNKTILKQLISCNAEINTWNEHIFKAEYVIKTINVAMTVKASINMKMFLMLLLVPHNNSNTLNNTDALLYLY